MTQVLAVEFVDHGVWHYLRPAAGLDIEIGDQVNYPTSSGNEIVRVVWKGELAVPGCVPTCSGIADSTARKRDDAHRQRRAEILAVADILIAEHDLTMKVLGVDYHDPADGDELAVVYYQAPERVDFRALVSELARALGCRVDLRQVAVRDGACLVSDIGVCGRTTCCCSWSSELKPSPIGAIALPALAPVGMCGRQMCCMRYESEDEA